MALVLRCTLRPAVPPSVPTLFRPSFLCRWCGLQCCSAQQRADLQCQVVLAASPATNFLLPNLGIAVCSPPCAIHVPSHHGWESFCEWSGVMHAFVCGLVVCLNPIPLLFVLPNPPSFERPRILHPLPGLPPAWQGNTLSARASPQTPMLHIPIHIASSHQRVPGNARAARAH